MAWIKKLPDDECGDDLQPFKAAATDPKTGIVDNIIGVHSLDAGSMAAHLGLYRQAMRGTTTLPKVDREMIALVVSQSNECHY